MALILKSVPEPSDDSKLFVLREETRPIIYIHIGRNLREVPTKSAIVLAAAASRIYQQTRYILSFRFRTHRWP